MFNRADYRPIREQGEFARMITSYHTADVPFTSMDIPIPTEMSNFEESRGSE